MKMILRWFGEGHDSVPLQYIRQIPGVSGVAATLMDKQPGEQWQPGEVNALKAQISAAGLAMPVIESVNVHDAIKLGAPEREEHIEAYINTLQALGKAGVQVVCYNFMPLFDWLRTDLALPLPDGSNTMAYSQAEYERLGTPLQILERIQAAGSGWALPGWEPQRLGQIEQLLAAYEGITTEVLHQNLGYFLDAILPVCEQYGIRMAIHPDDPPWEIYGLPRVFAGVNHARSILSLNKSPANCITLCTGSLGVQPGADLPASIRALGSRIAFAHVRNFKRTGERDFYESAHLSSEGSLDMYAVLKALHTAAPDCYIRPDHGRMLWGEQARAGYGLYDRALGAVYIQAIWEALEKENALCS